MEHLISVSNLLILHIFNHNLIFLYPAAFQYVNENAERIRKGDNGPGQGIIGHLLEDGEIPLEEASRIIVDLFIAAADTVSALF